VTPTVGMLTSFVETGTTLGFQFVFVVQAELVAPVQVTVFVTVNVAVAVRPVPPSVEVTVPVVFVFVPEVVPRTWTLMAQLPLAAILPPERLMLVAAAVGANVPPQVFVAVGIASTSVPAGKVSVIPTPLSATLGLGFVSVMVKVENPLF